MGITHYSTVGMSSSRMTSKYQATIPKDVRDALQLGAGDRVEFVIAADGVRIQKATRRDAELSALEATLAPEWDSEADDVAFRDL